MTECLDVAVALIMDKMRRVLITQRAPHSVGGGYWEFPGGKLEAKESASEALVRELQEEVGLHVLEHTFLERFDYAYPTRVVSLWVYHVSHFAGEARCCEAQQDLRWVTLCDLRHYRLLEASQLLLTKTALLSISSNI